MDNSIAGWWLAEANNLLSSTWGGDVRLSVLESFAEHPHVLRLRVETAPAGSPETVILKRGPVEDSQAFEPQSADPYSPAVRLFNEWAALEFLHEVYGEETPAPHLYAGDQVKGFLVMEDLPGDDPLQRVLWGSDPEQAEQMLLRCMEELGGMHARTANRSEQYSRLRQSLGPTSPPDPEKYARYLGSSVQTLDRLGIRLSTAAREELREAAQLLAQPEPFQAFTHGDAIIGNWAEAHGRLRLFDFESAWYDHTLLEGANPRMLFTTCALNRVYRLPEPVWRNAEAAYLSTLGTTAPEAARNLHMTAACAFWALALCQGHISLELAIQSNEEWVNRLRQRILARFDQFVLTTHEFGCLTGVGQFFESLTRRLRSEWPAEADGLPFYPVFKGYDYP